MSGKKIVSFPRHAVFCTDVQMGERSGECVRVHYSAEKEDKAEIVMNTSTGSDLIS